MSRYDDLRRMREAKFASQQATKVLSTDATKVAAIPATKSNNATKVSDATKVKMGRPLISDHPMTNTERSRRYRANKKAAHTLADPQGTTTSPSS
jgi:hypothetical protein